MPEQVDVVRLLAAATIALLALRAAHLARTRRFPGTAWLAVAFGLLAAGVVITRLAMPLDGPGADAAVRAGRALVVGYPVGLLWFVHAISPVGLLPRAVTAAGAAFGIVAVLVGSGGGHSLPHLDGAVVWTAYAAVLSSWVVAHGVAALRLRAAARAAGASVYSRRLRAMAGGSVVLGTAMLLAAVPQAWVQTGLNLVAVAAAVLFWTGVDPPEPLRVLARHRGTQALREVGARLLRATRPGEIGDELLPLVAAVVGGDAAWLTQHGTVIGHHGLSAAEVAELSGLLPRDGSGALVSVPGGEGWIVAAPAGAGWLAVRSGPFTPIFGSDGLRLLEQLAHELGVALERVHLQKQEHDSLRRLETAERLRDDLLSTVSHELRTPLTAIRGFAGLLAARWCDVPGDQRRALFERIVSNTQEMEHLVDGLLRLSELRAGGTVSAIDSGLLDRVVEAAVHQVGPALDGHSVVAEAGPVPLRTDLRAVQHIVAQFLHNAAVHTPSGTTVAVEASGSETEARVVVSDEGPGLKSADAGRVFEPFYRAGDMLTRGSRGAGIGLALVREQARAIGGTVSVTSARGEGASFVLTFPRIHPGLATGAGEPAAHGENWPTVVTPAAGSAATGSG